MASRKLPRSSLLLKLLALLLPPPVLFAALLLRLQSLRGALSVRFLLRVVFSSSLFSRLFPAPVPALCPRAQGIGVACTKGLKPESPNQDSFCCIFNDVTSGLSCRGRGE